MIFHFAEEHSRDMWDELRIRKKKISKMDYSSMPEKGSGYSFPTRCLQIDSCPPLPLLSNGLLRCFSHCPNKTTPF